MKKETGRVVEGTFGRMREVEDFLPPPEVMAQAPAVVEVNLALSSESVSFLLKQAKQHNMTYKQWIRHVLEEYVAQAQAAEEVKQG